MCVVKPREFASVAEDVHAGRREFIGAVSALSLMTAMPSVAAQKAFSFQSVIDIARQTAAKAFVPVETALPAVLAEMDYDAYRRIQFRKQKALWINDNLGFRIEFFHRGGLQKHRIDLFEVADGVARPLIYASDQFYFDPPQAYGASDIGYAGFRLNADHIPGFDEIASFLGASYFRALGACNHYGLSARGLALGTASPEGEEFPIFRRFWIERPKAKGDHVRIYALLDSPSVAGAYQFTITPGAATAFDVETVLFPRKALDKVGLAPLTSMYLHGSADPGTFEDYRGEVHDSDCLDIANGAGERLVRPLTNPSRIEDSAFQDKSPKHFGLMQRQTAIGAYEDYEARYDMRPSALVIPANDWGAGSVRLFELPSNTEGYDNVVAFWRPAAPLKAHTAYAYAYRLVWGAPSISPAARLRVLQTRVGRALGGPGWVFIVDFAGFDGDLSALKPAVTTTAGQLGPVYLKPLDTAGTVRASFHFNPETAPVADLRLTIDPTRALPSEIWIFRWTS